MIKYLVMDVDGTLTDGKIYIGNDGECFKAFSVKDGYVINYILKPREIEPVIITARNSQIVQKRCDELGIKNVFQGEHDKLFRLEAFVGKKHLDDCAYFGDDVLDLSCMIPIKEAGGIVGCPSDAVKEVKAVADYVCENKAGEGALREFVEWLVEPQKQGVLLEKKVAEAVTYIESIKDRKLEVGKYVVNEDFFYLVQEYNTKPVEECKLESHKEYVDIQWIIQGEEIMLVTNVSVLSPITQYDAEKDTAFWKPISNMMQITLQENGYVILYPNDAHMGCIMGKEIKNVKKIVGKVRIC